MPELVKYRTMTQYNVIFGLGTILSFLGGFILGPIFIPFPTWDWISVLGIFVGLPVLIASFGYYYGWYYKVNVVEYTAPEWDFEPVQLTIQEIADLPKKHNKKYQRLVAQGTYWDFFFPIVLLVFIAAIPVYTFYEDATIAQYSAWLLGISLAILYANTLYTGFRTTSNEASSDFTLPLIRETIKLANVQKKIHGISNVRVVLDKAESGDYAIYQRPRVLIRIRELEHESYVESWTDDLGAISRILGRLYAKDEQPQIVWWWIAEDRNFRKYIGDSEEGYYVKNPVRSNIKFPGVKDTQLVTENCIALIVREYIKTRDDSEDLRNILKELKADIS
jgi:hypothetical protein